MLDIKITDVRTLPGDSAFLIDDGKTAILYDTGFGFTGFRVAENIRKVLGDRPLDYIFLTHSHYDHALGAAYVTKCYPEARVVASEYAGIIFSKPSARAHMRELDRKCAAANGVADYEDLADDLRMDIAVNDGDWLACGDLVFQVVALPGHTKCSVGFYLPEKKLLLGSETLGVYFGMGTYLPSCLVGYQLTLESFQKARQLDIEGILLPHYGPVYGEVAVAYLENSQRVTVETARTIMAMLQQGKFREEILEYFTETVYSDNVKPVYPIDAFRLNTGIMIDLIAKELGGATWESYC